MKYKLSIKWEDSITGCKNFQRLFLDGSTNYKPSAASEQKKTDQHLKSIKSQEDYENQLARVRRKCKILQKVPEYSTLKQGFNKMSPSKRESLEKYFDIAYFLAKKGQPYSDFSELISLQKMQGVKFSIAYNNSKACTKFISFIIKSIFEESIKSKFIRSNFIAVLCDGSTDSAVVEKERFMFCSSVLVRSSHHYHFFI